MGQKVNPLGIRLGITRDWIVASGTPARSSSRHPGAHGFPGARVPEGALAEASVSRIQIERAAKKVNITIQTARPGIVIGKKGEDIEKLRAETAKLLGMPMDDVRLNIAEIRKPELDAQLVAEGIAQQIEKRVMFRRAMKRAVMSTMRSGALGMKVRVSGRLNGSEIARTEWYARGPRAAAHVPRRHRLRPRRGPAPPTASSASRCGSSRARCSTRPSSRRLPPKRGRARQRLPPAAAAPAAAAPAAARRRSRAAAPAQA